MKDVELKFDENGNARWNANANKYKVVSIAKSEGYKQRKHIEYARLGSPFTFTHMDNIQYVIANVPDKHCGYLLYLQCFIDYNGRIQHGNNKPMSRNGIAKTLGLSGRLFSEFMKYMIDNQIIIVDTIGRKKEYRIDKRYHWRGSTNNTRVIKSFHETVKLLYAESDVKDLGFIYKLLPYVHISTNYICSNPHEIDVNKIVLLNKAEISQLTGLSEKTVYSKLRNLKVGDEYVFAEIKVGKSQHHLVNPRVFFRKDGYPDDTLRATFAVSNNYRRRKNN